MSSTDFPLPLLGEKGRYFLKTPFHCDPDLLYECVRLCSLHEAEPLDVWRDVYQVHDLSEEVYQQDVRNDVKLVFLAHKKKDTLIVPQSYLQQTPDQNYVPYSQVILTIDLGLLPNNHPCQDLKQELESVATHYCQADTLVNEHRIDEGLFISYEEHLNLEIKRLGGQMRPPSVYTRLRLLETENEALSTALHELQQQLIQESV